MTAQEIAAALSNRPALAIGFPIWAAARNGACTHRLTLAEVNTYASYGLITDVVRGSEANPSEAEAAAGLGYDARVTELGREVAALLA